jgi:hypothetical protein
MIRSKLAVVAVAVTLAFSSINANAAIVATPAAAGSAGVGTFGLVGCVAGIMLAAVNKGNMGKGQLTGQEAASCGLLYWLSVR